MKFGNLNYGDDSIMEGLQQKNYGYQNTFEKKGTFSKILTTLSHFGMQWEDDVLKNMQAIPKDKSLLQQTDQLAV